MIRMPADPAGARIPYFEKFAPAPRTFENPSGIAEQCAEIPFSAAIGDFVLLVGNAAPY
jgi:hypothetical protein